MIAPAPAHIQEPVTAYFQKRPSLCCTKAEIESTGKEMASMPQVAYRTLSCSESSLHSVTISSERRITCQVLFWADKVGMDMNNIMFMMKNLHGFFILLPLSATSETPLNNSSVLTAEDCFHFYRSFNSLSNLLKTSTYSVPLCCFPYSGKYLIHSSLFTLHSSLKISPSPSSSD